MDKEFNDALSTLLSTDTGQYIVRRLKQEYMFCVPIYTDNVYKTYVDLGKKELIGQLIEMAENPNPEMTQEDEENEEDYYE